MLVLMRIKTLEVMKIKKFWNWIKNDDERTLFLNGVISDETWYGDEITPKLFKDELNSESGDIVDRKSTRLNSSHVAISYAVFCLKKKTMDRQLLSTVCDPRISSA